MSTLDSEVVFDAINRPSCYPDPFLKEPTPDAFVSYRSYDDKLMEFALMQIRFPDPNLESSQPTPDSDPLAVPAFFPLKNFKMTGLVMNVFLLDPVARLLSGFIWIVSSSTIGLFVLPDWNRDEYVFVDTKIPCVSGHSFLSDFDDVSSHFD